jgi:hypothetical protein
MRDTESAFEAASEAGGHRPKAEGHEAEAVVALLAHDKKAVRILAEAEAAKARTQAAIEAKDAEAVRKAKAEESRLQGQLNKAKAKAEAKTEKGKKRAEARAKAADWVTGLIGKVQSEAAASYSGFVYLVAICVAVISQGQGIQKVWTDAADLVAFGAGFVIEAIGLAFYATSVVQRLDNRSGLIPRLVAWGFTGFAASMQFWVHSDVKFQNRPVLSYALMTITVAGMLLAEVRTTHKVGKRLEALGQKDKPLARLGLKFCLRYFDLAWFALSAMIANPTIVTRGRAIKVARRIKVVRYRKAVNESLMREAKRSLKAARKAKSSEAILFRLNELAYLGLEAVGIQEAITSASVSEAGDAEAIKAEAEIATVKAEAELIGDRKPVKAIQPSRSKAVAQSKAKAAELTAGEGRPDETWAERPGKNPFVWEQRLAELAQHFPGTADDVPSRQPCIDHFKSLRESGEPLRFAWTNKEHVGYALNDLKALRSAGCADPQINEDIAEMRGQR